MDGDGFVDTGFGVKINEAVFPGLQGGPHMNSIAGIAVGLLEASQPAYHEYIRNVVANSRQLAESLMAHGNTVRMFF